MGRCAAAHRPINKPFGSGLIGSDQTEIPCEARKATGSMSEP